MPLKRRPLDRDGGVERDASLVIIASEDTHAPKQYFSRFKTKKLQFVVLNTENGESSPENVVSRLLKFETDNIIEAGDTFWLLIDRDRWTVACLSAVLSFCKQKDYGFAICNPCFELWILLHFSDFVQELESCSRICDKLKELLGGYTKSSCKSLRITGDMVLEAMERARAMDVGKDEIERLPSAQVYKIMDLLIAKDAIQFI